MARKSSKSSGFVRVVGRAAGALTKRWNWRIARIIAVNAAVGALVIGGLAGAGLGERWMKQRVAVARQAPLRVEINWPAIAGDRTRTWLPESARREVMRVAKADLSPDAFDQASLERTRQALAETGWFTAPPDIRREAGGLVRVRADWRTPAAVVRWGDKDHLVAGAGELLPLVYERGGAGPHVRVIEGAEFGPPAKGGAPATSPGAAQPLAYGEQWPGGEVQAALSLLGGLKHAFGKTNVWSQIAGVDASAMRATGALAIITDTGSRVVWGAAPGKIVPGEQTVDQKLARLARLAGGATGRIDAGEQRVEIHGAHVFVDEHGAAAPEAAILDGRR